MIKRFVINLLLVAGVMAPKMAFAHDGLHVPSSLVGFLYGFVHPIAGLDHLLAMLCVGILSSQIGGRAIWQAPTTFVGSMAIGAGLAIYGFALPAIETAIALSVLALGVSILAERHFPIVATMAIVGAFGLVHGHAHGEEIPDMVQPLHYIAGFLCASTLIHILGVLLGEVMTKNQRRSFMLRLAGALIAVMGVTFLI